MTGYMNDTIHGLPYTRVEGVKGRTRKELTFVSSMPRIHKLAYFGKEKQGLPGVCLYKKKQKQKKGVYCTSISG
jgi:hypothetical protein